jgi:MscS family membrane protein
MKIVSDIFQFVSENLYLRFLLILVITLILACLAKVILKSVLKPLAQKTKTKIDDLIVKSLSSIIFYIFLVLGLKIGFQKIKFESKILNNLIDSLLIVIVTIFIIRILHDFSQHWLNEWASKTKSTADDRLIPLIEKILKVAILVLAVIFIFNAWQINISPLLATAGIAGLAVGLAVKDSLSNILGGIQLVLDRTFKVGDKVQLESGETGVILDIGLRSTKLKTYDNEVIYIPNGYLANAKVKNFTMPDLTIRVNIDFGVEYGSDSDQVKHVVLEAIKKVESVLEEPPPDVLFSKMSDFSLDFVARAWVKNYTEAFSTKLNITDEIYKALNKANIGIPFPTRTVYTKNID